MSRIRTGLKPNDWREEEPREAHTVNRGGSLVTALPGADLRRQVAERVAREKAREKAES